MSFFDFVYQLSRVRIQMSESGDAWIEWRNQGLNFSAGGLNSDTLELEFDAETRFDPASMVADFFPPSGKPLPMGPLLLRSWGTTRYQYRFPFPRPIGPEQPFDYQVRFFAAGIFALPEQCWWIQRVYRITGRLEIEVSLESPGRRLLVARCQELGPGGEKAERPCALWSAGGLSQASFTQDSPPLGHCYRLEWKLGAD